MINNILICPRCSPLSRSRPVREDPSRSSGDTPNTRAVEGLAVQLLYVSAMYAIDERDRVILIDALPQPDVGAPIPVLVADEDRVALAYVARPTQPSHDESITVAEFVRPCAHMFGPPNDEAFEGHPLAGRGLEPYGVFRIEDSSWLRGLEQMNSVHEHHSAEAFAQLAHYVFAFHDSTFEIIAADIDITIHPADSALTLSVQIAP